MPAAALREGIGSYSEHIGWTAWPRSRTSWRAVAPKVHVHPLDERTRDAVAMLERNLSDANLLPDVIINNAGLSRGLDPI